MKCHVHSPSLAHASLCTWRHSLLPWGFCLLAVLCFGKTWSQNHPNGIDFIGPDGLVYPDFTFAGVPGGIPDVEIVDTLEVNTGNDRQAFLAGIARVVQKGGGALWVPNGVYNLSDVIPITEDRVVIRGESTDGVIIRLNGSTKWTGIFSFEGTFKGEKIYPGVDIPRGTTLMFVGPKASTFEPGDYVSTLVRDLPSEYVGKFMPTDYSYVFSRNMFKIKAVQGQYVELSQPTRIDYRADQTWKIRKIGVVRQGGIENLTLVTPTNLNPQTNGINFRQAAECWVKNVKILKPVRHPIGFSEYVKHISVVDCYFDDAWDKGGGGKAYGGFWLAYDCLMQGTTVRNLRHAPNFQEFAAGNVITDCDFFGSNGEMHANFARYNLIDNCRLDKGASIFSYSFMTQRLDNVDYHNPTGAGFVLYNNAFDAGSWGGGIRLGGLDKDFVIAHNRFIMPGNRGGDLISGVPVEIMDYTQNVVFQNNVFITRDVRNYRAGVVFQPGYIPGFGQSGIGQYEFTPQNTGYAYVAPPSPPVSASGEAHFIDNVFYGVPEGREWLGFNRPATDKGNVFHAEVDLNAPRPVAPVPSIYLWQMEQKGWLTVDNGLTFPVELSVFTVRPDHHALQLDWGTQSETGSAYFQVERSLDGLAFQPLAEIPSAGTTLAPQTYHYSDNQVRPQTDYFYRLRMVDLDGSFSFSEVKKGRITARPQSRIVECAPNPTQGELSITLHLIGDTPHDLLLLDTTGREWYRQAPLHTTGLHRVSLDLSTLPSGVYYLMLSSQFGRSSRRIMIERN